MSGTGLARRLGRSRSDLTHSPPPRAADQTIDLIDSGQLKKAHGKALLSEPDHDRRRQLARRATESGWSVRDLEAEIAGGAEPRPMLAAPHPDHVAAAATLDDTICKALGIGVQARPHHRGYQLLLDQTAGGRLAQLLGRSSTPMSVPRSTVTPSVRSA